MNFYLNKNLIIEYLKEFYIENIFYGLNLQTGIIEKTTSNNATYLPLFNLLQEWQVMVLNSYIALTKEAKTHLITDFQFSFQPYIIIESNIYYFNYIEETTEIE